MSKTLKFIASSLTVAVMAAGLVIVLQWQKVSDQLAVWSYQPDSSIVALADRGDFSDDGRFYFYLARPEFKSNGNLGSHCRMAEQGNPVLGCYLSENGLDRIYILDVDNPDLDGIREVTAAHEMLHVVYSRLSTDEIDRLSALLEKAYERVKTPKLEERMDYYQRTEPGARINELHSIIGTEFSDIGQDLEDYYGKYFVSRQKIVSLHSSYNKQFEDLENESKLLESELKDELASIENRSQAYVDNLSSLNLRITEFNGRANSGGFSSRQGFESSRLVLQSEINALNQEKLSIEDAIEAYNDKIKRLNDLGVKLNELQNSLKDVPEGGI